MVTRQEVAVQLSEFVNQFKDEKTKLNKKKQTTPKKEKQLNLRRLIVFQPKDHTPRPSFYHPQFKRVKEDDRAHHRTHSGMLGVTRPRPQEASSQPAWADCSPHCVQFAKPRRSHQEEAPCSSIFSHQVSAVVTSC